MVHCKDDNVGIDYYYDNNENVNDEVVMISINSEDA